MYSVLENNPVIAAVKSEAQFELALKSDVDIIFLLQSNIMCIEEFIKRSHTSEKYIFLHIDMADGLGRDSAAILYLKSLGIDGIITTRGNLVRIAHENGLKTVQRFFVLDSKSIETSLETLKTSKADMVEIMPGIMPKIIKIFSSEVAVPIIAGGLINDKKEVIDALSNGAVAISTSNEDIWFEK